MLTFNLQSDWALSWDMTASELLAFLLFNDILLYSTLASILMVTSSS